MRRAFAGGGETIVTTDTGLGANIGVIKSRTKPGGGHMADIASRGSRYVGWPFSDGDDPVVATFTGADDFGVIHAGAYHGHPTDAVCVTGVTIIRGVNVSGAFTDRNHPVVATDTGT